MIIKCEVCKKDFYARPSDVRERNKRFCSIKCSKIGKINVSGEKHSHWKGEKASYGSIHYFVRRWKNKPKNCELCGKKTDFLDLANISQTYKRELNDWEYLCRKCHMIKDGRINIAIENLKTGRKTRWDNEIKYNKKFPFNKIAPNRSNK